ncbi:MAG: hypothetical protein ABIR80_06465, partial [Opitutaceae bacterium]
HDWPALIASLQAKGFPPAVIRSIVSAQVNERFRDGQKALEAGMQDIPFWKNPIPDAKTMAAARELNRERQKILKDLFGSDLSADDPISAISAERQFAGVPAAKRDQIRQIMQDFSDQQQAIYDKARGSGGPLTLLADDQAKVTQLQSAQHAAIAQLLAPQELENYDLVNSNTATSLRYNLTAFDATDAEFRAIYKLQSSFDEQFNTTSIASLSRDEQMLISKQRSDAQKQLTEQIAAALGSDRFAAYERAIDYSYRQTSTLVSRLELPPETANQVYAVQQDIQKRVLTGLIPPDQRASLAEEANAKIVSLLGPRGFEAYKTNGGQWLQNLAPRPIQPGAGGRGGRGG